MPKCLRSAAEVLCVRVRVRETVSCSDGSAAEIWIGVSSCARECSESVVVSIELAGRLKACGRVECGLLHVVLLYLENGPTEEEREDVEVWDWIRLCGAVEDAF